MDEPIADLEDEPTVPCKRCGAPIPLKSFRLPPALCDKCRAAPQQPMPSEIPGMDERPTKRRGPIGWLAARTWRFWAGMALLFMLYVASVGPAELILTRQSVAGGDATRRLSVDYDYWTPTYAPLLWIARHNDMCRAAMLWYRELFPHKLHTRP